MTVGRADAGTVLYKQTALVCGINSGLQLDETQCASSPYSGHSRILSFPSADLSVSYRIGPPLTLFFYSSNYSSFGGFPISFPRTY